MKTNDTTNTGPTGRIGRIVMAWTVAGAVFLSAGAATAATLSARTDPGDLPARPAPASGPGGHNKVVIEVTAPARPVSEEPLADEPVTVPPSIAEATVAPVPAAEWVPATPPTSESAEALVPVAEATPVVASVPAPPPAAAAQQPPAPTRCIITYTLDGVSPEIAAAAFAVVEAQIGVDLAPADGPSTVHIRSYWPADNPTNAFGWTGDVGGQQSIYLKPILERTPDFARLMLVHELGHVLGLGHTASGSPMDNMPTTDQFTAAQRQQMKPPC